MKYLRTISPFIILFFLVAGCAMRVSVPIGNIENLPSIPDVKKAPFNVVIYIKNEDATYEHYEDLGDGVSVTYTFLSGQLIKKISPNVFSQFFNSVEVVTGGPSPAKADLVIIPVVEGIKYEEKMGLNSSDHLVKSSVEITLLDNNGITLSKEIFNSPNIKKTKTGFFAHSKTIDLDELGKLVAESIASALEEAAKEAYKVVVQPEYAIGNIRKMISADPINPIHYLRLSSFNIRNKQYDESITAAKRAIELKPDNHVAYKNLGYAYQMKKQYNEAFNAFKKAIELDSASAVYRSNMGNLLLSKDDYAEAAEAYKKAVELQPSTKNFFNLANSYKLMGKYDDAIAYVNKAIELQSITGAGISISIEDGYTAVREVMGTGPAKKAGIEAGDKIIRVDGKSTEDWTNEMVAQKVRGTAGTQVALTIERKGIDKPFERLITRETIIDKNAAFSFGLRSLIHRCKGNKEESFKDAEKAYSLDSVDDWARLSLGATYLDRGKYEEAIKLFAQVEDSQTARLLEATAYAKQGKMKEAANIYLSIPEEEISPKNIPLMNDRMALLQTFKPIVKEHRDKARSFESKGQEKEALAELSEVLKIADDTELQDIQETLFSMIRRNPLLSEVPEDARKYALRSEVMVKEGNFEQAATELKKAIQIAPYAARLYYNAALINAELKKYPEAIRHMKIYLKAAPDAPDDRAAKDEIIKWEFMMESGK